MLSSLLQNKIVIVTGHYGSGKTNFAVNLAAQLKKSSERPVSMADIDIVNPYFRAADSANMLSELGVRCIIPAFANSNVDIPSLPPELNQLFYPDTDGIGVLDVGGDDAGATALGMYRKRIAALPYAMLYAINCYRPLTATAEETVEIMREIEAASGLCCTAIVNNSNLGVESELSTLLDSIPYAEETARLSGLPLLCHTTCLDIPDTVAAQYNIVKLNNYIHHYGGTL